MTPSVHLLSYEDLRGIDLPWPDVYFEPGYGRAEEAAGNGTWRCLVAENGEWLLPFHTIADETARDAVSPYGYSGAYGRTTLSRSKLDTLWDASVRFLRDEGITSLFLRQTPLLPSPFERPPGQSVISGHETFAMKLDAPATMWNAMEGRARTSIRKAQREGYSATIKAADFQDLAPASSFRVLYQSAMERRSAAARYYFSDEYYLHLRQGLKEPLLIGRVQDATGTTVAASLFLARQPLMHYHLSAGSPAAGRSGATNLLLWTAALYGAELGYTTLHLGGGIMNGDGLARFKRSIATKVLSYNAYGVVINERRYNETTRRKEMLGSTIHKSFFPAYRG